MKIRLHHIVMMAMLAMAFNNLFGQTQPANFPVVDFSKIQPDTNFENVLSRKIFSDSLVSTFVIWIKKGVPPHYHANHSEQVYVLEGEAEMEIGEKKIMVKKGDWILLPKGTVHSVSVRSIEVLKVISVQAPMFDGRDRHLIMGR